MQKKKLNSLHSNDSQLWLSDISMDKNNFSPISFFSLQQKFNIKSSWPINLTNGNSFKLKKSFWSDLILHTKGTSIKMKKFNDIIWSEINQNYFEKLWTISLFKNIREFKEGNYIYRAFDIWDIRDCILIEYIGKPYSLQLVPPIALTNDFTIKNDSKIWEGDTYLSKWWSFNDNMEIEKDWKVGWYIDAKFLLNKHAYEIFTFNKKYFLRLAASTYLAFKEWSAGWAHIKITKEFLDDVKDNIKIFVKNNRVFWQYNSSDHSHWMDWWLFCGGTKLDSNDYGKIETIISWKDWLQFLSWSFFTSSPKWWKPAKIIFWSSRDKLSIWTMSLVDSSMIFRSPDLESIRTFRSWKDDDGKIKALWIWTIYGKWVGKTSKNLYELTLEKNNLKYIPIPFLVNTDSILNITSGYDGKSIITSLSYDFTENTMGILRYLSGWMGGFFTSVLWKVNKSQKWDKIIKVSFTNKDNFTTKYIDFESEWANDYDSVIHWTVTSFWNKLALIWRSNNYLTTGEYTNQTYKLLFSDEKGESIIKDCCDVASIWDKSFWLVQKWEKYELFTFNTASTDSKWFNRSASFPETIEAKYAYFETQWDNLMLYLIIEEDWNILLKEYTLNLGTLLGITPRNVVLPKEYNLKWINVFWLFDKRSVVLNVDKTESDLGWIRKYPGSLLLKNWQLLQRWFDEASAFIDKADYVLKYTWDEGIILV